MFEYKEKVASVFDATDEGVTVLNGTAAHARAVFETAFDKAQHTVRILANDLENEALGTTSVANSIDRFLRRGGHLDVLLETEPTSISPLAATLLRRKNNVSIYLVPEAMQSRYRWNAMIVDDKAYRFQESRHAMVAVVAGGGGNAQVAEHLSEQLDIVSSASAPFDLAEHFGPGSEVMSRLLASAH
jgi:hypothetical protein